MSQNDQADRGNWSALIPEFAVRKLSVATDFYVDVLGFSVRFTRPESGFAFVELGHAQIMLYQIPEDTKGSWLTGPMEPPFGRGVNLQIEVPDIHSILSRVLLSGHTLFSPLRDAWYRQNKLENGQAEFLVQDPDGYLLRFMQHLGQRAVARDPQE